MENIPATIVGWYLGTRTGEVMADMICGDDKPGGYLTGSFSRRATPGYLVEKAPIY